MSYQKILIYFVLFSSVFICNARAGEVGDKKLNQLMTEIGMTMTDIFPLIVAKRKLSRDEQSQLKEAVARLSTFFKQAKPFIDTKSSSYQVSYDFILEHLAKTERSFQNNNIAYTRKRLYALGNICASCHTQDNRLRTLFSSISRQKFQDDFSFAEFNYITRDYNQAVKYFDKYLRSDERKTELEIMMPMRRLITINTQIFDTPGIAAQQLAEYRQLKEHTKKTKKYLEAWIASLKSLRASRVKAVERVEFATLEKYVAKYIGDDDQASAELFSTPEQEVSRVWLRGQLYHYLNTNPPTEEVPAILYWLSICDRSVGYDFYFSLADLYLKQCVLDHPSHPYAQRCYKEYKDFIEISYSGSAGTFIPPELEDELSELRQVLKKQN